MDRKGSLKISLLTLGCKVNQSDAASLASELSSRGHTIVASSQSADVTVIHTCTVTQKTDYQSRQLIRREVARNPAARVIVTGCYAQVCPEALVDIPGVECVIGCRERGSIPDLISGERRGKPQAAPVSLLDRTRPFLKVQDGCNSFCSYCIVPYARGRNRSLPLPEALEEARRLSGLGFQEVVLTGIHLGSYGEDLLPPRSLLDLLQALEEEPLNFRLRLSSIEPRELHPALIGFLAGSSRICPHLHVPLQSGDDGILEKMNRNYSGAYFEDLANRIFRSIPGLALGLDVIGGFPGESEEAFQNTIDLIERLPLAYLHVFPFSRRKGTAAYDFPGQVPSRVIHERCRALRELGARKKDLFYRSFLGRKLKVLVESRRDPKSGMLKGYSQNYIPFLFPGGDKLINREVEAVAVEIRDGKVIGRINSPQTTQSSQGTLRLSILCGEE